MATCRKCGATIHSCEKCGSVFCYRCENNGSINCIRCGWLTKPA